MWFYHTASNSVHFSESVLLEHHPYLQPVQFSVLSLCKMRCMSYACNMHMTCIHVPINMPIIWFMPNACHMLGSGAYFNAHVVCVFVHAYHQG